jgi:hypothetical protein
LTSVKATLLALCTVAAVALGYGLLSGPHTPAVSPSRAAEPGARGADPEFGSWWHDGKAELDGYRLKVHRYGEERRGQAVLVYVTEPFSESKRVKVDDASKNPPDTFDALKLNLVRDFQTGIYDYNTMVSLFVRSNTFEPVKLSFSSAEWCGHVYQEMIFGPKDISSHYFSYFENESSSHTLDRKPGGVVEDNLFILLRGLDGRPWLDPGQARHVDFLPSPFYSRLSHHPVEWTTAEIERLETTSTVDVAAGRFETSTYEVRILEGRTGRLDVETAYPHRIVRWSWAPPAGTDPARSLGGLDSGELTGSARLEYWKLHGEGDQSYLKELGLEPTVR